MMANTSSGAWRADAIKICTGHGRPLSLAASAARAIRLDHRVAAAWPLVRSGVGRPPSVIGSRGVPWWARARSAEVRVNPPARESSPGIVTSSRWPS